MNKKQAYRLLKAKRPRGRPTKALSKKLAAARKILGAGRSKLSSAKADKYWAKIAGKIKNKKLIKKLRNPATKKFNPRKELERHEKYIKKVHNAIEKLREGHRTTYLHNDWLEVAEDNAFKAEQLLRKLKKSLGRKKAFSTQERADLERKISDIEDLYEKADRIVDQIDIEVEDERPDSDLGYDVPSLDDDDSGFYRNPDITNQLVKLRNPWVVSYYHPDDTSFSNQITHGTYTTEDEAKTVEKELKKTLRKKYGGSFGMVSTRYVFKANSEKRNPDEYVADSLLGGSYAVESPKSLLIHIRKEDGPALCSKKLTPDKFTGDYRDVSEATCTSCQKKYAKLQRNPMEQETNECWECGKTCYLSELTCARTGESVNECSCGKACKAYCDDCFEIKPKHTTSYCVECGTPLVKGSDWSKKMCAECLRQREHRDYRHNPDLNDFNTQLAKEMKKLKKDVGAETMRQGYKGTGSQSHRRQIFVRFPGDKALDIWLDTGYAKFGGVITNSTPNPREIVYGDKTPQAVYGEMVYILKTWLEGQAPSTAMRRLRNPSKGRKSARCALCDDLISKKPAGFINDPIKWGVVGWIHDDCAINEFSDD